MSKLAPNWQKTSVFETVFDQLSDSLVLYDPEFRITGVNCSAEKLFGKSSGEMLGKQCQDVFRSLVCRPGSGALLGLVRASSATNDTFCLDIGNRSERR